MRIIKKIVLMVLLICFVTIPIQATTMPEVYEQPIVELRGAWVSTVSNIDITQQTSIEQYQQQYIAVLDTFERYNMNAVFFQVRPTNDAFYESEINPWSRFLIGAQGRDPGWDPLPWLIEQTHARGMEFHAWLNPYRVTLDVFSTTYNNFTKEQYEAELNSALNALDNKNFAKQNPHLLVQGGRRILLNPGEPAARQHIFDTITEIVEKYNVDAIHFDDYFYNDVSFNADFNLFMQDTNSTTYDMKAHQDWRRTQVDILVEGIHLLLKEFNEENNRKVQFGISPAVGWAPAISSSCPASGRGMVDGHVGFPCGGYSSYHDLYADTRKWVLEEWLDYILPQNYFELGRYHELLSEWWANTVRGTSVKLYMGLGVYQYANYSYLTENEVINQIRFNEQFPEMDGYVIFSYRSLAVPSNARMQAGVAKLRTYWTRTPLLPMLKTTETPIESTATELEVMRRNRIIDLSFQSNEAAIGYAIYRFGTQEEPSFTNESIYTLVPNTNDTIKVSTAADNLELYTFYVQAIKSNGELSSQIESIATTTAFQNNPPVIVSAIAQKGFVYASGNTIHISGELFDPDGDELEVKVLYSTDNGVRYRHEYNAEVVGNTFSFAFNVLSITTNQARLKVVVNDGSQEDEWVSEPFMVVSSSMGILNRQMYFAVYALNDQMKKITGGS